MRPDAIRSYGSFFALALLLMARQAVAMDAVVLPPATAGAMAQAASPQAMAEYRRKLKEYLEARAAFDQEASAYWSSIADKRRVRNAKRRDRQPIALDDYVLTQPPVYSGPKRPVDPSPEPAEPEEPRQRLGQVGPAGSQQDLGGGPARIWRLSRKDFAEDRAQGKDIRPLIHRVILAPRLLRSHVAGRSRDDA